MDVTLGAALHGLPVTVWGVNVCDDEQYFLDLEREAILSLAGEQKTLERIEYMLRNGKPLRN